MALNHEKQKHPWTNQAGTPVDYATETGILSTISSYIAALAAPLAGLSGKTKDIAVRTCGVSGELNNQAFTNEKVELRTRPDGGSSNSGGDWFVAPLAAMPSTYSIATWQLHDAPGKDTKFAIAHLNVMAYGTTSMANTFMVRAELWLWNKEDERYWLAESFIFACEEGKAVDRVISDYDIPFTCDWCADENRFGYWSLSSISGTYTNNDFIEITMKSYCFDEK